MKTKNFLLLSIAIILVISLWGCSHKKALKEIKTKPSPPASQVEKPQAVEPKTAAPAPQPSQEQKPQEKTEEKEKKAEEQQAQEGALIPEKADPAVILEEALNSYQEAQAAWERGDFNTALITLDETYSLILKAKLPPDSPLNQEKNDLRLLVAQRIQEIYATRLVAAGDNHKTIPLVENKFVNDEIQSFQTKERKYFEEAYKQSGLYRPMIVDELKKAGLPEELCWLPMIESWFRVRALSRARALGLWQFISSTGYRFGLKRDRWIDERMDPLKATQAAIKYLSDLHDLFGDWTTALAAYNCGEIKVEYVIRSQHIDYLDNFWDLYLQLPIETARFVPRFIAAVLIINNPEKYGFNFPTPDPPLQFETAAIDHPFKLSSLSAALGLDSAALASLNPELRYDATPEYEYSLKVPVGYSGKIAEMVASLPRWIPPEATYIIHYVQRGETVGIIAQRYGTSVAAIARANGMRSVQYIWPGQRLKIPSSRRAIAAAYEPRDYSPGQKINYIVKNGDSLYQMANAYKTTVEKIKAENNLTDDTLAVGQKLVISSGMLEGTIVYKVMDGDTLFSIAKKFGMDLAVFLSLNNLSQDSKIYPGQEVKVTPVK
jgi:membrane-bound lytic murein transglycosylase D